MTKGRKFGWDYQVKFVLDSTEPANYMGSYAKASKEIVDTKITMRSSSLLIMTAIITALPLERQQNYHGELLLSNEVVSEEEEGGLRK
jgi:hypothetical protein